MKVSKPMVELGDFLAFPVWIKDPDTEQFSPAINLAEEIESIDDLYFRVQVSTPQGFSFDGFVCGIGDVGMGIFASGKMYPINSNFPKFCVDSLSELSSDNPELGLPEASSLFPLRFETIIEREPFKEFSGEIDARLP